MPKFTLTRVRLNSGGYTSSGEYFGIGQPLYHYEAEYPDTWNADHVPDCSVNNPIERGGIEFTYLASIPIAHCAECGRAARIAYNDVADYIRADNREHAKAKVIAKYPDATFYK